MTIARTGQRAPSVTLGELRDGAVKPVQTEALLAGRRAVIIGVPGAFTPVCTTRHAPEFIAKADMFRAAGFSLLACIAPNDPWTVAAWAAQLDPQGKVRFLSDGNLDFARGLGLVQRNNEMFLGQRPMRYLLMTQDAVIERLKIEKHVVELTVTQPESLLLD